MSSSPAACDGSPEPGLAASGAGPPAASLPLHGIRVLDLSRLLPGPLATMVLRDLGASVDKIEDPAGGDYLRLMPPQVVVRREEGEPHAEMNAVFHALNRGARSCVLDLKKSEGREALLRILPRYDVLVESFRPGVLARLGLAPDALFSRNPRLVLCSISGYGQTGPLAHRAGHDIDYLARAGVLGMTGPEGGPPQLPGVQLADVGGGGLMAVVGILAALLGRERTGRGGVVDASMCEGALLFGIFGLMSRLGGMAAPPGGDVLMGGIAPYGTYVTKDGRAVALGALEPKFWLSFCAAVGLPGDLSALAPGPHQAEWKRRVADVFASRTRDEWAAFAAEHDCCLEPVLDPEELPADPQHRARRMFLYAERPSGAPLPMPRTPVAPAPPDDRALPAPPQGAHTREVLREGGLADAEIDALVSAGAAR